MKFGVTPVPDALFALARDRSRASASFTPEEMRQYLLKRGSAELLTVTTIPTNQRIVAERVMRAVIKEQVAAGELVQFKRGLWMKASVARVN